ncbi:MAG: threonine ammonia-lyase, partial [Planctomycetaceae bacterium]
MHPVTYADVLAALPRVRSVLQPTPLHEWPLLGQRLGCRFFLKHENHQPIGAFKVRGGVNLVSTLSDEERAAGLLGCSTGNHGQSLAFAAKRFGVKCTIVVPENNNPDKNRAIRSLGAELIEHGRDFDEAKEYLETHLAPRGGRYVHSANEPLLIAG